MENEQTEYSNIIDGFKNTYVQIFKLQRSHLRLFKTMIEFAKVIGFEKKFIEIYYDTILEEKKMLLALLEQQLIFQKEIKAPNVCTETKKLEIESTREIVANLEFGDKSLFVKEITNMNSFLFKNSEDLTTEFVDSSDFPYGLEFDNFIKESDWKHDLIKT